MEQGLTNVAALKDGWAAWQQAGYPIEGEKVAVGTATPLTATTGEEMAVLGSADAPVTIFEYSDFQ